MTPSGFSLNQAAVSPVSPGERPAAILLDLDDTILDFSSGAESCWAEAFRQCSKQVPGVEPSQFIAAATAHSRWFWSDPDRHRRWRLDPDAARREIATGALARLGLDLPDAARALAAEFLRLRETSYRLFSGSVEALEGLQQQGVRLALITNGDSATQRRKIDRFELARHFCCIIIEEEFGVGKPDRRVYFHALAKLGVAARDAWMVGDNLEFDVAAPQSLGLRGIWCDPSGHGLPPGGTVRPDHTIRTLAELL